MCKYIDAAGVVAGFGCCHLNPRYKTFYVVVDKKKSKPKLVQDDDERNVVDYVYLNKDDAEEAMVALARQDEKRMKVVTYVLQEEE